MGEPSESDKLLLEDRSSKSAEGPGPGPAQETQRRPWLQSLKGILAAFMFVIAHVIGVTNIQLLQRRIPDLELQVFRCVGIVLTSLVWMLAKQRIPKIPWQDVPVMLFYGFIVILDSTALYIGFALFPGTAAQCAETALSLLSGLFIYWLCGQERFSCKRVLFAMLCLGGAILVLQPWDDTAMEPTMVSPMWSNYSGDCILQMQKLCSLQNENLNKVNLANCENQNMTHWNETILCETLLADSASANFEYDLQFNCAMWQFCWFDSTSSVHQPAAIASTRPNEKGTVIFLQPIPQKYVTLAGIVSAGFSGVTLSFIGAMLKKYECLHQDRWRSLFWSFSLCLVCSVTLTFVVESPVWPGDSFDILQVSVHALASAATWVCLVYSLQLISGSTFNIIISTLAVVFLIPQYTILSSILPGQRNWMEVVGVFIVLTGSVLASVLEMFQTSENV